MNTKVENMHLLQLLSRNLNLNLLAKKIHITGKFYPVSTNECIYMVVLHSSPFHHRYMYFEVYKPRSAEEKMTPNVDSS